MSQFYFVLTNPEAETLLKKEIQLTYPTVNLSYSRSGFLTFKGEQSLNFHPKLARLSGICLGKFKKEEINLKKAWVWKRDENLVIPEDFKVLSENSFFKIGEKVTLIMMIAPEEYWIGEYELLSTHFQTPGEVSSIIEKEVPSRAYYKMAEAFEAFDLPFHENDIVLELGSAPGGASLFLLDQGMKVIGVDPAEMDKSIASNPNFKHLKKPFETLTEKSFRENVNWIVSDINLPPTVVLKEVYRLLEFLNPIGLILTLKLNQDKHIELLKTLPMNFKKAGFNKVALKYLPSHRQEIALIALRT